LNALQFYVQTDGYDSSHNVEISIHMYLNCISDVMYWFISLCRSNLFRMELRASVKHYFLWLLKNKMLRGLKISKDSFPYKVRFTELKCP